MLKITAFIGLLLVYAVAANCAMFTNTGSADWSCHKIGFPFVGVHATGTNITISCPPDSDGPSGMATVGNLSASVFVMPPFGADVSLQSIFTDSLIPVGATGSGTVEFTLTYTFGGFTDTGIAQGSSDLFFNGLQVATIERGFCDLPNTAGPCSGPQHVVDVIDEPITYGVPFSYQADDFLSSGFSVAGVNNNVMISASLTTGGSLVEVPEPNTLWLCGFGSLGLLFGLRRKRRVAAHASLNGFVHLRLGARSLQRESNRRLC